MLPAELEAMRRGWCPTLHHPMTTGDGLLVRLQVKRARLTAAQARAIAAAALACGSGLIDLSSRGNLQIRGVRPTTHRDLITMLGAADIDDQSGGTRCLVSPLAGIDPTEILDAGRLADQIDAALVTAAVASTIPAKLAIVVDGGGLPLNDVDADIRFVATDRSRVGVAIAGPGDDLWIGSCSSLEVPSVALSIVSEFCRVRGASNSAQSIRYLSPRGRQRVAKCVRLGTTPPLRPRVPGTCVGSISVGPGRFAVGLGLTFGRLDAGLLDRLAGWSEEFGTGELRLSPWRSIFIPEVGERDVLMLLAAAAEAGLIIDESDPRRAIVACPGAPACARASVSTHADAARLVTEVPSLLEAARVHVSGCAKGCARRAATELTLVGKDGRYGVVIRGNARDQPLAHMEIREIIDRLKTVEGSSATQSSRCLRRAFAAT